MFAYLFASLIQFAIIIGLGTLVYQVFLSDWISARRREAQADNDKKNSLEKIAQVKLVSDEQKDIEKFITENAQYLSDDMVKRLVARIEDIKNDNVISADTLLKTRIDQLEIPDEPVAAKQASQVK